MESDESASEVSYTSSTSSTLVDASHFHTTYKSIEDVPFTHVSILGEGSFGFVDKVVGAPRSDDVDAKPLYFARKRIRLQRTQYKLEKQMRLIRSEVEIVKKLSHPNITSICSTYECGTEFGMLITPIAEGDLKDFMEELDEMPAGVVKLRRQVQISSWMGSLVDALSYLHSLPICHKDLKPANILVKDGNVYITDFGIARDLINETTTASTGTVAFKSPMYSAPEVLLAGRRGRASDVYSMGCVFLELLTLASGRSLLKFNNYRTTQGSRAYANNEKKVVSWIQDILNSPGGLPSRSEIRRLTMICFLMLAPAPKERITMAEVARGLTYGMLEDSSVGQKTLFTVRRQRRVTSTDSVGEQGAISIAVKAIGADGHLMGHRLSDHTQCFVFSMSCAIEPSVLNMLHEEATTSDLAGESELQKAWLLAPDLYFFNPRTDCRVYPDVPTSWIENARTKARARYKAPMWTFIRLLNFEWNMYGEKLQMGKTSWESARTMMSTVLPFRRADTGHPPGPIAPSTYHSHKRNSSRFVMPQPDDKTGERSATMRQIRALNRDMFSPVLDVRDGRPYPPQPIAYSRSSSLEDKQERRRRTPSPATALVDPTYVGHNPVYVRPSTSIDSRSNYLPYIGPEHALPFRGDQFGAAAIYRNIQAPQQQPNSPINALHDLE